MSRPVFSTLLAAGLSAVLALGGVALSAAPARADNDDAARIIGGIIALYAIGRAIELSQDRRRPSHAAPVAPPPQLVAPQRCFIEGQDRHGPYRGYGRRCMQDHAARAHLLPQACLITVQTQRGPREIYAGRCLAQNGWVREAHLRH